MEATSTRCVTFAGLVKLTETSPVPSYGSLRQGNVNIPQPGRVAVSRRRNQAGAQSKAGRSGQREWPSYPAVSRRHVAARGSWHLPGGDPARRIEPVRVHQAGYGRGSHRLRADGRVAWQVTTPQENPVDPRNHARGLGLLKRWDRELPRSKADGGPTRLGGTSKPSLPV